MRIKAKFVGKDSLGYVHGQEYELLVERHSIVKRAEGGGTCPYSSIGAFLANWDEVRIVNNE